MSDTDDSETYYATLGLPPDATFAQVKARYKEVSDAYLKILELSRKGDSRTASQRTSVGSNAPQVERSASSGQTSASQGTHTESISALKEKLANGKIDKAQFEKLAKARYDYLMTKSFSDLSDSEFEERLKGFEGLKIDSRSHR